MREIFTNYRQWQIQYSSLLSNEIHINVKFESTEILEISFSGLYLLIYVKKNVVRIAECPCLSQKYHSELKGWNSLCQLSGDRFIKDGFMFFEYFRSIFL